MDNDDLAHLVSEVAMGIGPEGSTLPDTAEVRSTRARLKAEVADIRGKGLVPDVGMEFPDAKAVAPVTTP
jgi:hypothetical protein